MSYMGIMLKSVLFCKHIKEYDINKISYIEIFNEINNLGKVSFSLPVEWIGEAGKYSTTIEMLDLNGEVINIYNNEFTLYGYSSWRDIVNYNVEFTNEGTYKFIVKCNGNIYLELPLRVSGANHAEEAKTIEYYIDYLN